jgi:hypothetical protein
VYLAAVLYCALPMDGLGSIDRIALFNRRVTAIVRALKELQCAEKFPHVLRHSSVYEYFFFI